MKPNDSVSKEDLLIGNLSIDELIQVLRESPHEISHRPEIPQHTFNLPLYLKMSIIAMCVTTIASLGVGIYSTLNKKYETQEQEQAIIDLNSKIDNLTKSFEIVQDTVTPQDSVINNVTPQEDSIIDNRRINLE